MAVSDADLYEFWNAHITQVSGCTKCAETRDSPEICEAYATEGVSGKASKPHTKRACCRWAHSLSVAQIVAHTKRDPRFSSLPDKALRDLAKRFMKEMKGATPLGTPHRDREKAKLDYRVRSRRPPLSRACTRRTPHQLRGASLAVVAGYALR